MRKLSTLVLAFSAFVGMAGPAQAMLIYDFSFDNVGGGNTAGPITGEIHGLLDNTAGQTASAVIITGIGDHTRLSFATPYDVIAESWFISAGSFFTVSAGVITDWDFLAIGTDEDLDLGSTSLFHPVFNTHHDTPDVTRSVVGGITFTLQQPVSVPEPGTLALLGIGLLGIGAARRRRKA